MGDFAIGTSGVLRSGATAYGTGTGIWMDYNGGMPRFRVGNPSGARMSWDGSTMTIRGDITADTIDANDARSAGSTWTATSR